MKKIELYGWIVVDKSNKSFTTRDVNPAFGGLYAIYKSKKLAEFAITYAVTYHEKFTPKQPKLRLSTKRVLITI